MPGRAILGGGCLILGQEIDASCSDFDELQALDGDLDLFRIWTEGRTAEQIKTLLSVPARVAAGANATTNLALELGFDDPASLSYEGGLVTPGRALTVMNQVNV